MQLALILLVCALVCTGLGDLNSNWRLLWSDEFNGNQLDTSKWTAREEPGNYGNGELQYYLPSQVQVSNGSLVITSANITHNEMKYVSGKVDTKDKFSETYGRYEVRAKLPAGTGLWPAIWLLSQSYCWPKGSEIDIMEFIGGQPNAVFGNYHHGECCGTPCDVTSGSGWNSSTSLANDYHVFAVEWSPSNIIWYVDGVAYWNTTSMDGSPHYIILNAAVGGFFSGNPDATTPFPSVMYVDYVRVYAWKTGCDAQDVCSNNGCCLPTNVTCACNPGWTGSSCEFNLGTFSTSFAHTDSSVDSFPNGWGNGYALYLAANSQANNGLTLTITNAGCPSGCGNLNYSAGGWLTQQSYEYGTFSFIVRASNVNGTGLALSAVDPIAPYDQIAFVIRGAASSTVSLSTTTSSTFNYISERDLGFDASQGYHNYSVMYMPNLLMFMIDGVLVQTAAGRVPRRPLSMAAYYSPQPDWYGGSFMFSGNSTVSVRSASWLKYPNASQALQCECVGGPRNYTQVAYNRNFTAMDSDQDSVVNGWGNGFALYLAPNTVVNRGLTLSIAECSTCGAMNYSAAGWNSVGSYSYGIFTFIAKSTRTSGTALTLGVVGGDAGQEQITLVLGGANPSTISATSWHERAQYTHRTFTVPFDASAGFHNYTIVYKSRSLQFFVDGVSVANATEGVPTGSLSYAIYYSAQPEWYGPFNYTGPSSTVVSSVHYDSIDLCGTSVLPVNTTTTSQLAGTTFTPAVTTGDVEMSTGGQTTTSSPGGSSSTTGGEIDSLAASHNPSFLLSLFILVCLAQFI